MVKRTEVFPEQETECLREQRCFQNRKQNGYKNRGASSIVNRMVARMVQQMVKNILSYQPCSCNILITLQSIVRYPNTVLSYDSYIFSVICDSEASKRGAAAPGRQPIYMKTGFREDTQVPFCPSLAERISKLMPLNRSSACAVRNTLTLVKIKQIMPLHLTKKAQFIVDQIPLDPPIRNLNSESDSIVKNHISIMKPLGAKEGQNLWKCH